MDEQLKELKSIAKKCVKQLEIFNDIVKSQSTSEMGYSSEQQEMKDRVQQYTDYIMQGLQTDKEVKEKHSQFSEIFELLDKDRKSIEKKIPKCKIFIIIRHLF